MGPSGAFETYGTEPSHYMGGGRGGGYGFPMHGGPGPGYDMRGGDPYMGGAMQGGNPYGYATQGAMAPPFYSGPSSGGYPVMMGPGGESYGYGGMDPGLVPYGGSEYNVHAHGMGMYGGVPPNHVDEALGHGMRDHAAEDNRGDVADNPAQLVPRGRYFGGSPRGRVPYGGFRGGAMQRGRGRGVLLCCHFLIGQCAHGTQCRFSHDDTGGACRYGGRCRFGHYRRNQGQETMEPVDGCSGVSANTLNADPNAVEDVVDTNSAETA